jgi:hypothetical protein
MRPKDFWGMHPEEFWWLFEIKRPVKMYGSMTEDDVAALYNDMYGDGERD